MDESNMDNDKPKTTSAGSDQPDARLLDDEAFLHAAEAAYREAGSPAADEVSRRRVWQRIHSQLKPQRRGFWPLAAVLPLAAAVALYVFFPRDREVGNSGETVLPGSGVKGAGDMLPVSLEVMEVRDGNRFVAIDTSDAIGAGTLVSLMVRGGEGKYALVSVQSGSGPHEVISAGFVLPGQDGALLIPDQDPTGQIWKMALPGDGDQIRFCAVASSSRQNLASLIPVLRNGGTDLPAMMECQTIQVVRVQPDDGGRK